MFFPALRRCSGPVFGPGPLVSIWLVVLAISGCNERDRLTFPTSDGEGPKATITDPSQDTTVTAGAFALVGGRVTDGDGIDTVYFEVTGGGASFPPFIANGDDTVSFSLPLATNGFSGITMTVTVFGTDLSGARGDSAVRQVTVQ